MTKADGSLPEVDRVVVDNNGVTSFGFYTTNSKTDTVEQYFMINKFEIHFGKSSHMGVGGIIVETDDEINRKTGERLSYHTILGPDGPQALHALHGKGSCKVVDQ